MKHPEIMRRRRKPEMSAGLLFPHRAHIAIVHRDNCHSWARLSPLVGSVLDFLAPSAAQGMLNLICLSGLSVRLSRKYEHNSRARRSLKYFVLLLEKEMILSYYSAFITTLTSTVWQYEID